VNVLVFPREDSNPYQGLLYGELELQGARCRYLGRLTPSHTLNLLLLPAELAVRRMTGWRVVHVHWVFGFSLPGSARLPVLRRLSQAWLGLVLACVRLLRMRLVWTAHNVLPHAPVFHDDIAARRRLVAACDLVIGHHRAALTELAALGAEPHRDAVIPHGPFFPSAPADTLRAPGEGNDAREVLFFGKVQPYKGVETLIRAFLALPADVRARLTVAGECSDSGLRSALLALAGQSGGTVRLQLRRVPDDQVSSLLASADVVALPFERVTTSGSAVLALGHGRPLIVPAVPALADLPDAAVIRYDGSLTGLTAALAGACRADKAALAAMSRAASQYSGEHDWAEVAARTMTELTALEATARPAPRRLARARLPLRRRREYANPGAPAER
jgi:glycosyltransferase involved in cell wall biosynthesis